MNQYAPLQVLCGSYPYDDGQFYFGYWLPGSLYKVIINP